MDKNWNDNKEKILKGLEETAKVVVSSLGPQGSKVALVRITPEEKSYVSQDGVNICKAMPKALRSNRFEEFGARLLVDAASKTVDAAGDGTTTTCLLAWKLSEATKDANVDIVPELKALANDVVDQIKEMSREPSKDELRKMAVVTARSRPDVGKELADLIWQLGPKSHIQAFPASETKTEIKKGYEINSGMLLPTFWRWNGSSYAVQAGRGQIHLIEPHTLLVEEKISSDDIMLEVLKLYQKKDPDFSRPLALIVSDIDGAALQLLATNFAKPPGQNPIYLPVFPIKAPESGSLRIDILDDLNAGLGGHVYSKYSGRKLKNFDGNFGQAESITIFPDNTHILFKDKYSSFVEKRAKKVTDEERLSKLTKGVGIVHIGGRTDVEHAELNEVVEDVVRASQAALEDGVLPGGGYAFQNVNIPNTPAGDIFLFVFNEFFKELTKDMTVPKGKGVFNILTGKWEDPKKTQIFDSTRSVTESVLNSVSLICELLATKYAITC